jgi:hypothetical protein
MKANKRFTGKTHTKEARLKIKLGKLESKNPNWSGNKVGYHGIHSWVKRRKSKPESCEKCHKKRPLELANISGNYKRDLKDFEWLCKSCHSKQHRGKAWAKLMLQKRRKKNGNRMR